MVSLRVKAVVKSKRDDVCAVLLESEENGKTVPFVIEETEAHAIARSLNEKAPPRPLTHNLFSIILAALGGKLTEVLISHSFTNALHASIALYNKNGLPINLDCRPSDAILLAVTEGITVNVSKQIFEKYATDKEFEL